MTLKGFDLTISTTKAFYNILKHYLSTHEDWHHHPKPISANTLRKISTTYDSLDLSALKNIDFNIQYSENRRLQKQLREDRAFVLQFKDYQSAKSILKEHFSNYNSETIKTKDSEGNPFTKESILKLLYNRYYLPIVITEYERSKQSTSLNIVQEDDTSFLSPKERMEFLNTHEERCHIVSPNGLHICIVIEDNEDQLLTAFLCTQSIHNRFGQLPKDDRRKKIARLRDVRCGLSNRNLD